MIRTILQLLLNELSTCILEANSDIEEPPVVLGNIGLSSALGGAESYMQDKIVLSLVNLMEEVTLKNASPYPNNSAQPVVQNPPTFLNLFLLFTANFTSPQGASSSSQVPYNNGLTLLSSVIEFFQSQRIFTVQNSPAIDMVQHPALQELKIAMELFPLTFEQVNHLWGSLGGKQMPFVLYKARVLPLKKERVVRRGALIHDVQAEVNHIIKDKV